MYEPKSKHQSTVWMFQDDQGQIFVFKYCPLQHISNTLKCEFDNYRYSYSVEVRLLIKILIFF